MLDTVLKIGKAFRESPDGLKHHRYIKPCPQDTDKRRILRLSIPVNKNFEFDFDGLKEISDENLIRNKLFYLTFKTSDADGLVKYIFGDIYYSLSKGVESGYYRLGNRNNKQKAYQVSSFFRGIEDFKRLENIYGEYVTKQRQNNNFLISIFRKIFAENVIFIERLLKYQCGILEYLEWHKNKILFSKLLANKNELEKLTAKNVFARIKQGRNSKKTFEKIIGGAEPVWDKTEHNEELIKSLANFSTGELFLHFDFNGRHWYEFEEELKIVNQKLLEDFSEKSNRKNGYILKKYIYKTLSSPEKDLQFPMFYAQSRHRNKLFRNEAEILDLLYAIEFSKKALLKVPYTDIKIIVLPIGNNLTARHFEEFNQQRNTLFEEQRQEVFIRQRSRLNTTEQLFEPLVNNVAEDIIKYDLIFSKRGGQSSPDMDLVEISGIEKSHLREISQYINKIKQDLYDMRKTEIKADLKPFGITWSFLNILGDSTSNLKKYQNHLLKVLPKIYTGTYYKDPLLLPVLIQKTEKNIRSGKPDFNFLKYDFYFLTRIQNTEIEGGNLMKIEESRSYKIGLLLGELARQFAAWREDCPMKSFEKSYVGTLTRRITNMRDLIKFKTFIEEKLIVHERSKYTHETSVKLANQIKEMERNKEEKYDKNKCAFGFFESYFASTKQNNIETHESLENEKVSL